MAGRAEEAASPGMAGEVVLRGRVEGVVALQAQAQGQPGPGSELRNEQHLRRLGVVRGRN